ncbi:Oxidoreductase calI [Paramyrothecium foliicola]|nr:Oxidoreductase calI [Paramyrothecium foliicola]
MATKYEAVHETPNGPGDARPTARQIIEDEHLVGKWSDKNILVTGCSSGIGIETVQALHETGAHIYGTARDLNKAKTALSSIIGSNRLHLLELDLNSLDSVRRCAKEFLAQSSRLNILITNAGVMATPEGRTADGFETQFGTNHLAHFLLIQLLLPTLTASSSKEFQSRVIVLSSVAHRDGEVNFDNLNFDGEYDAWKAYAQSKTANLWTSNEIERRFGDKGVHSLSVHPGAIMTGLMQHFSDDQVAGLESDAHLAKMFKTSEQGAATSVWAATAKFFEGQGGKYLEHCQIAKPPKPGCGQFGPGYSAWAYDQEKAARLWNKSVELIQPFLS